MTDPLPRTTHGLAVGPCGRPQTTSHRHTHEDDPHR
jgi:hypothetical protein